MSTRVKPKIKRNPAHYSHKDLKEYIIEESERTGKSKDEILEDTFHDGYVVVSESGDGAFKVEGGQLFKTTSEKVDDLTECRRLRERFGPIASIVDYVKEIIMGSGYDVMLEDIHDDHQKKVKKEIMEWMKLIYQDVYTVGLKSLLNIIVDNALTDGFAAAEIVYSGENGDMFTKYAKPITTSIMSQEGGKLAKSDYTSYDIAEPVWNELKGIARLKIFLDSPARLRLMRRGRTWEADYWVLDQPNVAGAQGGMQSATQKNLQQGTPMQLTTDDLVRSTLPQSKQVIAKPSAYFLPWQIFSLSLTRRNWLEKGPSIILPALKTAQLLEKIMNAVGEGIYRAGNKKYFIICGTKDRPWGGIHIRNLLSQIKDASEKNWSTIPVPAGFDLKEAGGTVFEAQNAINYFLRVIAGIMHVSPSVLGLDAREAVKGTTNFTYLTMRDELRSQIRTQLVRLHIWSTYGQKKQKQGGYDEPQWIPELRAKTEDLLNPSDRLKLDIDILNAANPVLPQTKLEVERDIIETRGWQVDLPTQEEFMKELKAQQAEDKQFKEELRNKQLQNEQIPKESEQSKDKTMGAPSPPSQEKQQKRLEGGVSTRKTDTGATSNPPRGNTRNPREARLQIQESLANVNVPETLKSGDTFVVSNPFSGVTRDASKEEFAGISIEVRELSDAVARYNRDLTKIYMDPLIPVEYYKPIIAHEICQYILEFKMGVSYKKSEKMATELEDSLCAELGINPNVYERKCKEIMAQVSKRVGVKNPIDVIEHREEIQETKQEKSQKVELIIKTEPIKVEPLKTEKQDKLEITLKDDPDKKKANEEIHEKKKKILDKLNEQISKEGEN